MATSPQKTADLMFDLKAKFIPHCHYDDIKAHVELLFHKRMAAITNGGYAEARGIAVVGASGCGKSTCVNRVIRHHNRDNVAPEGATQRNIVSISVPSPATLKSVGHALLSELGYELQRERSAAHIWDQVRYMLKEQRVLFLYLDEAQDLLKSGTPKETQSVVNMLKTIMQEPDWPVNLILSGTPELTKILNFDAQLGRRIRPVAFARLNATLDQDRIEAYISKYADQAGLSPKAQLFEQDFVARLIFAADFEFGLLIELILDAIEQSLISDGKELSQKSFIDAFTQRSGCIGASNPFIAMEYERINVRLLLQEGMTGDA